MARRIRDLTASEWFHVFNRGVDRQDVFSGDGDYLLFEQLLEESVSRFALEVHAYALMSNHFHLLVHCPDGRLSDAMQRICGRFGAAYNRRTKREGPVFTNRFKSVAVTDRSPALAGGSLHPPQSAGDRRSARLARISMVEPRSARRITRLSNLVVDRHGQRSGARLRPICSTMCFGPSRPTRGWPCRSSRAMTSRTLSLPVIRAIASVALAPVPGQIERTPNAGDHVGDRASCCVRERTLRPIRR